VAVVLSGLDALRDALRRLPAELVVDGAKIIQVAADDMARQLQSAYPIGPPRPNVPSGNLRSQVRVDLKIDKVSARATVRNTAKHAWLFQHGSKKRAWKNGKNTGAMPAKPIFIPIAIVERREMTDALIDLVTRAGLTVTGTPT